MIAAPPNREAFIRAYLAVLGGTPENAWGVYDLLCGGKATEAEIKAELSRIVEAVKPRASQR